MKLINGLEPPFKPLLCQAAIDRFEELIDKNSVVLEFGSGASTLWLAERTWLTVSIEHDKEWFNEVSLKLCGGTPQMYLVKPENYHKAADEFPDRLFDVVFVDCYDKYRVPCIKASITKLKPGGWMVVDDAGWGMLQRVMCKTGVLARWERENYSGVKYGRQDGKVAKGMTSFFKKPEG